MLAIHWPLVALLLLLGLIGYGVLYSAGGGSNEPWAWRHAVRLAIGFTVMLSVAFLDLRLIWRIAWPLYLLTLLALIAVEIRGEISKGAQRWLDVGPIQIQPSEIMKIALVLVLARWFHARTLEDARRLWLLPVPLLLIAVPAALVLVQPDLGTAVMLLAAGGGLLFLGGLPIWLFLLGGGAVAVALPVLWGRLHDYQRQRVLTFLDPERDPLGSGYHIIQSKIALGSGGLFGKGFLGGTQAQLSYLPEKQTDFAFSMLAEEAGFVGAGFVLVLLLLVAILGTLLAMRAKSQFARLIIAGVAINFTLYVVINVAMVSGLIPVVGVPLPLISYGGTAMLTVLLGFGLVLAADAQRDSPLPRYEAPG
jgi:rod shape determining protein RodA